MCGFRPRPEETAKSVSSFVVYDVISDIGPCTSETLCERTGAGITSILDRLKELQRVGAVVRHRKVVDHTKMVLYVAV
jgi:transcription initiation factor IIE alpha subunit